MGTITHKFKGVEDVFLVEWYLELLKATHTAVAEMGEPMVNQRSLGNTVTSDPGVFAGGMAGKLDNSTFNHPVESNEFRVKANQVLNFLDITYDGVLQMLEQLGASEEEIMYAWDLDNQFYNDGDPWTYRAENIWTDRQGTFVGPNTQEVVAAGGDPRRPGVKLRPSAEFEEMADWRREMGVSPYRQDEAGVPMPHEGIFQRQGLSGLIANSATEWAIELGIGALVGPIGQHAFGKAFQKLSNGFKRGDDAGIEEGIKLADVHSLSNRINMQGHPSGVVNLDPSSSAFRKFHNDFVEYHGREPSLNEAVSWAERMDQPPPAGSNRFSPEADGQDIMGPADRVSEFGEYPAEWDHLLSPEERALRLEGHPDLENIQKRIETNTPVDEDLSPTIGDPEPVPSDRMYPSYEEYEQAWTEWAQRNPPEGPKFSEDYRFPEDRKGADPDRVRQWEWEDEYFENMEFTEDGYIIPRGHILATPEKGPGSIKFDHTDTDAFEVIVDSTDEGFFGYASRPGDIPTRLSREFQETQTINDMIRYRDSDTMVLNPRAHIELMERRKGFDPTQREWSATGEILKDPKLESNAWGEIEALGYDSELFIHNVKNSLLTARRSSDPERFFDVLNEARVNSGLPPHSKLSSPSGTSYLDQPLEEWEKMFLATYEHELAHLRIKQTGGVVQKERQAQQYMIQQLAYDGATGVKAPPGGYDELAWYEFQPKIKVKKQKDFSEGMPDPIATMAGGVQSKAGKLPELPDIHFLNEGSSFTNKSKAYQEYAKYIEMMENKNKIRDRLVGTLFYPLGAIAGGVGVGYGGVKAIEGAGLDDDISRHIDKISDMAGKVVDKLVETYTGIGNPVIDFLSPGFANQVFGMNQGLRGANLLAAANDADALDGIQGSLRQGGHNPQEIMPMDVIEDIKNGDAVLVGYETDADIDKAIDMGRKMGVHVSADLPHIWRKPKAKFALPPKGEPATVDTFKNIAMSQIYYPESRKP